MTQVTAQLNYLRTSPRRMRLMADVVRGKKVVKALEILEVMPKKNAAFLLKLMRSAVANAKHNHSLEVEVLKVAAITVDGGPVLKRWMPKAHGRATPVRERTSHIKLVLEPMIVKEKKNKKDSKVEKVTKK